MDSPLVVGDIVRIVTGWTPNSIVLKGTFLGFWDKGIIIFKPSNNYGQIYLSLYMIAYMEKVENGDN